ncbi:ETS translocation variant 4 [Taenia crassiceps]|uniref:ETS translocation variant 4 n=1 Tax=Taenia crassiceps TaxID=6207 RepID=A0ABR4QTT1_9CEST
MLDLPGESSYNWKNRKKTNSGGNSTTTMSSSCNALAVHHRGQTQPHQYHQHRHQQQCQQKSSLQLWRFLVTMLDDPASQHLICWAGRKLEFKLNEPEEVARLWGIQKNRPTMNYDKLSRSLRYYYEKGIISKVSGERYVYRFAYEPEVLAKLTLDETLSNVLPDRHDRSGQSSTSPLQGVVFPPPPPPQPPPHQISPPPNPPVLPPLPTQPPPPPPPSSYLQVPVQEMFYQPQWEDQIVYSNNCEYEWSDDYAATDSLSYQTAITTQQYDYAYTCEHASQVYRTDTDADNYVLFECPEYFS